MTTYRAGIIGLRGIAAGAPEKAPHPVLGIRTPYNHTAAYAQVPATELVAVCDIAPVMFDNFKKTWGQRWPETKTYTDYREMLAQAQLDILSICTPDNLHADMVVAAAEAGVKGIICEKPLATTIRDAERMIAAVEKHGTKMSVDHTRRWIYEFHEAREMVRGGRIGELQRIVATLNGDRAMVFRNGTHIVDLICFFAESDPEWVMGALDAPFDGYGPRYAGDGGHKPSTDPGVLGIVSFKNGVRALYQGSQNTVGFSGIDVIGSKGRIHIAIVSNQFELFVQGAEGTNELLHRDFPRYHTTRGAIQAAVEEMVELIQHGGESVSPPQDAFRTVQIIVGFLQSHHNGGCRVTMPIKDA